ncbi:MAG: branched-chain amino acid ABC transporter permease [Proteobacteria bacterium]|nr:branched-chain amino acid ABC transporter permease [Pseudomonadota bacterium]
MLALHLFVNGLVTGCALGMVAISFSLVYSTTRIFHVAHAGVYTLGGYVAWSLVSRGVPAIAALCIAIAAATLLGAAIQHFLYRALERRHATHLVVLIASLGALAVIQNVIAAVYSPNILQFPLPWASRTLGFGGVTLTAAQALTIVAGLASYAGMMWFAHRTLLGKRIRAVASNPFLAEITRLKPADVHVIVIAIASAIVCLPGVLVPLDLGLQPYGGVTVLLTATIAMIAGGVGSISGAFLLSLVIAIVQNLSLLVIPGEWSIGITFFIFVIFMLFRPRGLFARA